MDLQHFWAAENAEISPTPWGTLHTWAQKLEGGGVEGVGSG